MNVVLIGYRGSGKSAAGRRLAERLGWPFLDTDALIEQQSGRTIRDLFANRAQEGFRDIEARILAEVSRLDRHVISTGGGAVLRPGSAAALKRSGRLVWLSAPPEILWARIAADTQRLTRRPDPDPRRGLDEVRTGLRDREPVYEAWADLAIDTADRAPETVAEEIIQRLDLQAPGPTPAG